MAGQSTTRPLEDWLVLNMQLIAFPCEPQVHNDQNWLQQIVGDEFTSSRKAFERTDEGVHSGRAYRLQIDPLKLSWTVGFAVDADDEGSLDQVPSVGRFVDGRDWFAPLMESFLSDQCPPISRLAFAPKLMIPTPSRKEAYGVLSEYLPHVDVDPESSELQYRINRKRQSTVVDGLAVNRLATWSSVNIKLEARARMATGDSVQLITRSYQGSMLVLDVNTSDDYTDPLPADLVLPLWNELWDMASEIAERGDCP